MQTLRLLQKIPLYCQCDIQGNVYSKRWVNSH